MIAIHESKDDMRVLHSLLKRNTKNQGHKNSKPYYFIFFVQNNFLNKL